MRSSSSPRRRRARRLSSSRATRRSRSAWPRSRRSRARWAGPSRSHPRQSLTALALPALVAVSTLLHWLAGRRFDGLWIMPDEAVYIRRAEHLWDDGPWPLLHGAGAGYGLLYPAIAGLPLAVGDLA